MKKKLLWIMLVFIIVLLAGCKRKYIDSGDTGSRYAYGWRMNRDSSVTLCIRDKWEKDCAWQADYDESIFQCEPGKKAGTFIVRSRSAAADDVTLRLCPKDSGDWTYALRFSVQGDGSGGLIMLGSTHEEPAEEGSYLIFPTEDDALLLVVNSAHLWRTNGGKDIEIAQYGGSENTEQFLLTAKRDSVLDAAAQVIDTQTGHTLTVVADIDENGVITVKDVLKDCDMETADSGEAQLWAELGFTPPLGAGVAIRSAHWIDEENGEVYAAGALEVSIAGADYTLYLSLLPEIAEQSVPKETVNAETQEPIPVELTEAEIGSETVRLYQHGRRATAIWKHLGCNYVLEGRETDAETMKKAVAAVLGVEANG